MVPDRADDTDLRVIREGKVQMETGCPFCAPGREFVLQNDLAAVLEDAFPVSPGHLLVIPRRHVADYFDLSPAEMGACQQLLSAARARVLEQDATVAGFNVGINSGVVAGQTVMHCHIHLIPRREGDTANPRGGVRGVIPDRTDYPG